MMNLCNVKSATVFVLSAFFCLCRPIPAQGRDNLGKEIMDTPGLYVHVGAADGALEIELARFE